MLCMMLWNVLICMWCSDMHVLYMYVSSYVMVDFLYACLLQEYCMRGSNFFWSTIKGVLNLSSSLMMPWLDDASMCLMTECMWVCSLVYWCHTRCSDILMIWEFTFLWSILCGNLFLSGLFFLYESLFLSIEFISHVRSSMRLSSGWVKN